MMTGPWAGRQEVGSRLDFIFYSPTHRPDRLWAYHAIETYGGEEMLSHLYVISVVDRGE